jgi:uroporphyrinogen-III decarboxylase
MTSKERFTIAAKKGQPDRVPVVYYGFGASSCIVRSAGLTWQDIFWNEKMITKVMLKAYESWAHDNVCSFLSPLCGIDALKVNIILPEFGEPTINYHNPLIKEAKDFDKLRVKAPNPYRDGSMSVRVKATRNLCKVIGNNLSILGGFGGISTWAIYLRGMENFMLDSLLNRNLQEEYMEFLTEVAIDYCEAQVKAGCEWIISDESLFASELLGPSLAWDIIAKHVTELIKSVHGMGAGYILHCCGDISKTIDRIIETKADVISVDKIDLVQAKRMVKGKVALMGNIKYNALLGSKNDVVLSCKEALQKAAIGGGYLLSSGYIYPPDTPCENVRTLVESAKIYGRYK